MQCGDDPFPTGPCQSPLFDDLSDIEGHPCDAPFSALMSGSPGAIGSGQWYSLREGGGTHFDLLFQYEPPGWTYIQVNLHPNGYQSPNPTAPTGYW